ncbi:MAG TPA: CoA-binding protein, partial [Nocardioidaceae bacterium]|nr:CoA-binding protein [Nocardioidaceae bacterium]
MTTNPAPWHDEDNLRFMLEKCQTWAVVGLGGNPSRTAYGVARFLQQHGKRIVPIHPEANHVLGEDGYASLAEVPLEVDVVDVFRRSEAAGVFADQAVDIGAKAVWFQLGVLDR